MHERGQHGNHSGLRRRALSLVPSLPHLSPSGYRSLLLTLFTMTVIFSVVDLLSTVMALNMGLAEGNSLLIAMGALFGVGTVGALGILKLVFIAGTGVAALMGIRAMSPEIRRRALILLAAMTMMMVAVSINNLYWIVVTV